LIPLPKGGATCAAKRSIPWHFEHQDQRLGVRTMNMPCTLRRTFAASMMVLFFVCASLRVLFRAR